MSRSGCAACAAAPRRSHPPQFVGLAGRPFSVNETLNAAQKRAIAREAVELCKDGEPIIINGGTTTFQMVHFLTSRRMPIFTNSFPIAEHLLKHSKNTVMLSGGTIYREQNIILSPFDNDVTRNFYARRMFMGAQGLGPLGLMEADPLLIQAEQKLIDQADELVVLVDSSKFRQRSSLILCGLSRIATVITDEGIEDREAQDAGGRGRGARSSRASRRRRQGGIFAAGLSGRALMRWNATAQREEIR